MIIRNLKVLKDEHLLETILNFHQQSDNESLIRQSSLMKYLRNEYSRMIHLSMKPQARYQWSILINQLPKYLLNTLRIYHHRRNSSLRTFMLTTLCFSVLSNQALMILLRISKVNGISLIKRRSSLDLSMNEILILDHLFSLQLSRINMKW